MTPELYASSIIPNPDKYDEPFCTTLERWRDLRDAFKAGQQAAKEVYSLASAPKDGTYILIKARYMWYVAYWSNEEDESNTTGEHYWADAINEKKIESPDSWAYLPDNRLIPQDRPGEK